jgi:hypothetical protein
MTSRRALASVADGTVRAFTSRNYDVDGWWALGLLLAAVPPADPDFRADLLTGDATSALQQTELSTLGGAWTRYLPWSVERHGVPIALVRSATLTVRFDRADDVASPFPGGPDHSFVCSVSIEDDRGRLHERLAAGHCGRLSDFVDANPDLRPRRSGGPYDPGRVSLRMDDWQTLAGDIPAR